MSSDFNHRNMSVKGRDVCPAKVEGWRCLKLWTKVATGLYVKHLKLKRHKTQNQIKIKHKILTNQQTKTLSIINVS